MKKKPAPVRYAQLPLPRCTAVISQKIMAGPTLTANIVFERSQYNYDLAEAAIMKQLYHTLRFHMHAESISNFNTLIALYIEEQRYSEAKWYYLQINNLAHQQNDDNNVIASLVGLGMVKCEIGEFVQAKDDLTSAMDFAASRGRQGDVAEIKKKLAVVEQKRSMNIKSDIRYAELPEDKKN